MRALPFLEPTYERDGEGRFGPIGRRAELPDVDGVRNEVELVETDVERLSALLHVERGDGGDRIGASDRPTADCLVVHLLLQEQSAGNPPVHDPAALVGRAVHVSTNGLRGTRGAMAGWFDVAEV